MNTLPHNQGKPEIVEPIRKISKLKYSRAKDIVEQEISQRLFVDAVPVVPITPPTLINK
jgi:hypothetical protein